MTAIGCTHAPSTDGAAWRRTDHQAPDVNDGHTHTWICVTVPQGEPDWDIITPTVRCATCGIGRCGAFTETDPNPCMWRTGHDDWHNRDPDPWCYRLDEYLADWRKDRGPGPDVEAIHQVLLILTPSYECTWEELLETAWATAI